jgi:hypothetical protein
VKLLVSSLDLVNATAERIPIIKVKIINSIKVNPARVLGFMLLRIFFIFMAIRQI